MTWTAERDEQLRDFYHAHMPSWEIAEKLGVSQKSVQGRAQRLGMRFERSNIRHRRVLFSNGHKPADERSAELLRNAGVRI